MEALVSNIQQEMFKKLILIKTLLLTRLLLLANNWEMRFIDYKSPVTRCEKIEGSESETVYHEIRCNKQKEYVHAKGSSWTTTPPDTPLTATTEQHDFRIECPGKSREDINALWAYPAAAAGFIAVDVPTAVGTCCFAIISIPIEFIKSLF